MRATFLGTSGAWPTPRPGCACPQCAEARTEERYRRTRSVLHLDLGREVLLVDAGPDVHRQFESLGLPTRVDRVLVTHTHVDHCFGLDDLVHLRGTSKHKRPLVVHAAAWHRGRLQEIFGHLVRPDDPKVIFGDWSPGMQLEYDGVSLEGFETGHREDWPTTGVLLSFEFDGRPVRIAYATDMGELPAISRELLEGVDLLVGDGSFVGPPRHGHAGTDSVLRLAEELEAKRVAFTHIGHLELKDADLHRRLGQQVGVAYDGDDLLDLLPPA